MKNGTAKIRLILASKSPRRKELLEALKVPFEVVVSNYQEVKYDLPPGEYVLKNAINKCLEVAGRRKEGLIIGVDTVCSYLHHILEKPKDLNEARKMLGLLNNTTHEVHTGICIIDAKTGRKMTAVDITKIKLLEMTSEEIDFYLREEEVLDKAGGFAIQGLGALFIEKIEGDYYNVIGLPLFRLYRMLKRFGVDLTKLRKK